MKKLKYIILTLIIIGVSINSSCKREDFEYLSGPGEVIASGTIGVPSNIDQSGWNIVSGANEGSIVNGNYRMKLNENAVQLVNVLDANDQPILMSIDVTNSQPSENLINATSTAEALVFLFPFFCTSDLTEANDLKEMINSVASFDILVNTINSRLETGSFALSETNSELILALTNVINDIILVVDKNIVDSKNHENNKGFFPVPEEEVNGLKIVDLVQSDNELSIKISNTKKRWISVYIDKSTNGTQFVRSITMLI